MKHRSDTEEEGALGGRYKQPKAKDEREDLKELIDNHRDSITPEETSQDKVDTDK
jgi:hypothetical protein